VAQWRGRSFAGDDGLVGKRLELLKETVPAAIRVSVLVNPIEMTADKVVRNLLSAGWGVRKKRGNEGAWRP
jgi:hypothetical protein